MQGIHTHASARLAARRDKPEFMPRACVRPCATLGARGRNVTRQGRVCDSVSFGRMLRTGRASSSRKVVMHAVESPDSLDADMRYFDGDLEADEDDLLGIDNVAVEVFRTGEKDKLEQDLDDEDEEEQMILEGEPDNPYLDRTMYHVMEFSTSYVSVMRKDELYMDFTEVYAADRVDTDDDHDLEFFRVQTDHLAHVPVQAYCPVAWTKIKTLRQDNGVVSSMKPARKGEKPLEPLFQQTIVENIRMYLVKADNPTPDDDEVTDEKLDFREVYVIDGAKRSLHKHAVEGLELIGKPNCNLVIKKEGLKVVDMSSYPTVDQILLEEDKKEFTRIQGDQEDDTFQQELPEDLFKEEMDYDEPDVPEVDLM
mmetsp:Transcript_8843/g.18337  ORF Transcript_8843/g.18337 Transcript_8843/m.18337 type:complete len:368 (-) Transcript_8843:466-1569(-)|eukprot:CAMPEP_0118955256 /NCGR_PEP_ID=MMETSP1169-20130426/59694_1 /TAXON_ID=36882 /ORGANISM="Pyramimonas obovata, Strain CCMP722" /LENGTH=367 /DNA_ID=CAMNT_0006903069 /DNA_START=40 /DNA_END=1143 /DNA_ORIENTATION=-